MPTDKKRILWLDNLRGLLILTVVLGHVLQYYGTTEISRTLHHYIYSFHMPLFMLLSGYASYKPDVRFSLVAKRARQLMIPYLIWTVLECLVTRHALWDALILHPKYWFLLVLFVASCLHCLTRMISDKLKIHKILVVAAFLLALYLLPKLLGIDCLSMNVWAFFYLFHEVGSGLRARDIHLDKGQACLALFLLVPLFALTGYYYNPGQSPWTGLPPSFYFAVAGLVGSALSMTASRLFLDRNVNLLKFVGRLTLGIYVIHCFARAAIDDLITHWSNLLGNELLLTITVFIALSVVSTASTWALSKSKLTRFMVGL